MGEFPDVYLAGYFDGEGYVSILRVKRKRYGICEFQLRAGVTGVDPRPIEAFQHRFGGYVYLRAPRKVTHSPQYTWLVVHQAAARALTDLLPLLVVKRRDAEIAIAFQEFINKGKGDTGRWGRRALSEESVAARDAFRQQLIQKHGLASRAYRAQKEIT